MITEPEVFIATFTLLSLAGIAWLKAGGFAFSGGDILAMLTDTGRTAPVHRLAPKSAPPTAQLRTMAEPAREPLVSESKVNVTKSLATETHIGRLNGIVTAAVDKARNAERLHRGAHEQVDAAHYALQNLLNELSAVMPVAASELPARSAASRETLPQTLMTAETALAA